MVVIDYERKNMHLTPEFEKHPHALLFGIVMGLIPANHVFSDWFRIVKNAESMGILKSCRDDNG